MVRLSLHPSEQHLPVLSKLGFSSPPGCADATAVASDWVQSFSSSIEDGSIDDVLSTFLPSTTGTRDTYDDPSTLSACWRDILALTWEFRTFVSLESIGKFLQDRLQLADVSHVRLRMDIPPSYQHPYPDLAWIQAVLTFDVSAGTCIGIVRLVPIQVRDDVHWKAYTLYTALESLHGSPELIQRYQPGENCRALQCPDLENFEEKDPTVLIVGAGHNGLYTAARLKSLGVSTLVVERNERVGDMWRNRYNCLRLHDPTYYIQPPYIPVPSTWASYPNGKEFGDWLETYPMRLNLAVWTSATLLDATQDAGTLTWSVTITRADRTPRRVNVKHLVFATGHNGGRPEIPQVAGMDTFKGRIIHSSRHTTAQSYIGKKVVVVGSCNSAHDVCKDCCDNGVEVTMYQRSPTYVISLNPGLESILPKPSANPVQIVDHFTLSTPVHIGTGLSYRKTKEIAERDRQVKFNIWKVMPLYSRCRGLIDGLHNAGFRVNMGMKDAGLMLNVLERTGGHCIDLGSCQLIAERKIKVKSDSPLKEFTEQSLRFEDGNEVKADVVILCTGFGNAHQVIREVCGESVAAKCKPIWGLNPEGELNGAWREIGPRGLWYAMGNTAMGRIYSRYIAMQIKAIEDGLLKERYSIPYC